MHKKTIEIDFSKCRNNIVLLVGPNGSGKTALLSTLHPFAYPGNMDVRANSTMILEDHDGEKEIHYEKDDDIYIIKHFYKSTKKSMTVKSFISKNGEELNPNGNVTSFNDLVLEELGIQHDYLKLLRLGSNVTNIIEMKASERKNFTSDLFSELDILSGLYKKVNDDYRMLRNLLATVSNKLQRLNVNDKEELIASIQRLELDISSSEKSIDALNKQSGIIDGIIQTLIPEGVSTANDNIEEWTSEFKDIQSKIKSLNNQLQAMNIIVCGDIDTYTKHLNGSLSELSAKRVSMLPMIDQYQSLLNDAMNEYDDIEKQLKTVVSDNDMMALRELYNDIKSQINSTPKRVKSYKPAMSRDNLLTSINLLNEIDRIGSGLYEFGYDAVKECITLMRAGTDVDKYVADEVATIDKKIINISSKYKADNMKSDCIVLFRPTDCIDDKCPYLDLYNRFFKNDDTETKSVASLETRRDYLINLTAICKNLEYIMIILRANKTISAELLGLGIDYLTFDHISSAIYNDTPIFSETVITKHISDIEDYEVYQKKLNDLKDIEIEMSTLKSNDTLISAYKTKKVQLEKQISDYDKKITELKSGIDDIDNDITQLNIDISDAARYSDILDNIHTLIDRGDALSVQINDKRAAILSISSNISDLELIKSQIASKTNDIQRLKSELFDARYKYKSYMTLTKERDYLDKRFEDVSITKESLSSTKGAPLLYIQLYLQSTVMFVNDILSSIYENFEINGFEISESEFNIPYTKNGIRIGDVAYASQGERSFLSLALSFALIHKSIKDYNIILLDEIDATLDNRNRATFLNTLIQMIDLIDSDQVFMITHNNMFDSYPVDIVMTGDVSLDNYKNANVIFTA